MGDHGHVWTITMHLRWVEFPDPATKGSTYIQELQQAWENINGDVEWRPVPIVEK